MYCAPSLQQAVRLQTCQAGAGMCVAFSHYATPCIIGWQYTQKYTAGCRTCCCVDSCEGQIPTEVRLLQTEVKPHPPLVKLLPLACVSPAMMMKMTTPTCTTVTTARQQSGGWCWWTKKSPMA